MIYYFSGTGNSKWVANVLGNRLNEEVISILNGNIDGSIIVEENEMVGFVCPTYAWMPAEIMIQFIKRFTFEQGSFSFMICTCASEAGNIGKLVQSEIGLNSIYSIDMPNNYIIGGDIDSNDEIEKKLEAAKIEIDKIAKEVLERKNICRINKGSLAYIKTKFIAPSFNKFARGTKSFKVDDTCIGCGLCEKICPTNCIELINNKPVWSKETCLQCLGCINRCPKEAIQYGEKTRKYGRYFLE